MVAAPRTARKPAKTKKTTLRPRPFLSRGARLLKKYLDRCCHCPVTRPVVKPKPKARRKPCTTCGRTREKGLSLQAFGMVLGVSRGQVGMYTSGRSLPSLEQAVKIERLTGGKVSPDDWFPKTKGRPLTSASWQTIAARA